MNTTHEAQAQAATKPAVDWRTARAEFGEAMYAKCEAWVAAHDAGETEAACGFAREIMDAHLHAITAIGTGLAGYDDEIYSLGIGYLHGPDIHSSHPAEYRAIRKVLGYARSYCRYYPHAVRARAELRAIYQTAKDGGGFSLRAICDRLDAIMTVEGVEAVAAIRTCFARIAVKVGY